jgi:hypothetical protein
MATMVAIIFICLHALPVQQNTGKDAAYGPAMIVAAAAAAALAA